MGKNVIPEYLSRWATTNVVDHYIPYFIYLELLSTEMELISKMLHKDITEESDKRLESIRAFYSTPPGRFDSILGGIKNIEDWR